MDIWHFITTSSVFRLINCSWNRHWLFMANYICISSTIMQYPSMPKVQHHQLCAFASFHLGKRNKAQVQLKNISQNGNFSQIGAKITNIWNHHLVRNSKFSLLLLMYQDSTSWELTSMLSGCRVAALLNKRANGFCHSWVGCTKIVGNIFLNQNSKHLHSIKYVNLRHRKVCHFVTTHLKDRSPEDFTAILVERRKSDFCFKTLRFTDGSLEKNINSTHLELNQSPDLVLKTDCSCRFQVGGFFKLYKHMR